MVELQIMQREIRKGQEMRLTIQGEVRRDILTAAQSVGKLGAHVAPSLSIVELVLAVLEEFNYETDEFILSKGHGALGYYAVMHQLNMISDEQFASFENNGGEFPGQPSRSKDNKILFSSGSLGMGLSYGVGRAYIKKSSKIYVLMGDGELNEGSIWEAAMLASHLKLNNLVAIVDRNNMQSDGRCEDILKMNLANMWKAFGWEVKECNGHSLPDIQLAFKSKNEEKPLLILANTVKGKGVSFMENNNDWHHHELPVEKFQDAIKEIGETYGL